MKRRTADLLHPAHPVGRLKHQAEGLCYVPVAQAFSLMPHSF